jgi:Flp pilus assembly protein TadD
MRRRLTAVQWRFFPLVEGLVSIFLGCAIFLGWTSWLPFGGLRLSAASPASAAGLDDSTGDGWIDEDAPNAQGGTILQFPGMPPVQVTPDGRIFRPQGFAKPHEARRPLKPSLSPEEQAKAARAEALKRAMAPQKTHAEIRAEMLDTLFKHLAKASDVDEADGIAAAIDRIWLRSDSATADLLMERGLAALQAKHLPLALTLFDRLIVLEPNWAEAWEKRATTRLLGGDVSGAVADMQQVLKMEPRNFSTLTALGFILHRQGSDKEALAVLRKSHAINPQQSQVNELIDTLSVKVEGRDI